MSDRISLIPAIKESPNWVVIAVAVLFVALTILTVSLSGENEDQGVEFTDEKPV